MKKILFTSHTANFSKFNVYLMKFFYSQGWEVHYASMQEEPIKGSEFCTKEFKVPFARSPFSISNIKAISILKKNNSKRKLYCNSYSYTYG